MRQNINVIFDISQLTMSYSAIITDWWVTYEYYRRGEMVFFWISACILLIAQFSYSTVFCVSFSSSYNRPLALLFICIFPFAQLD
eukprot:UN23500